VCGEGGGKVNIKLEFGLFFVGSCYKFAEFKQVYFEP